VGLQFEVELAQNRLEQVRLGSFRAHLVQILVNPAGNSLNQFRRLLLYSRSLVAH
jgi:hypothetical protein